MAVYVDNQTVDRQAGHFNKEWLACYMIYVKRENDPC